MNAGSEGGIRESLAQMDKANQQHRIPDAIAASNPLKGVSVELGGKWRDADLESTKQGITSLTGGSEQIDKEHRVLEEASAMMLQARTSAGFGTSETAPTREEYIRQVAGSMVDSPHALNLMFGARGEGMNLGENENTTARMTARQQRLYAEATPCIVTEIDRRIDDLERYKGNFIDDNDRIAQIRALKGKKTVVVGGLKGFLSVPETDTYRFGPSIRRERSEALSETAVILYEVDPSGSGQIFDEMIQRNDIEVNDKARMLESIDLKGVSGMQMCVNLLQRLEGREKMRGKDDFTEILLKRMISFGNGVNLERDRIAQSGDYKVSQYIRQAINSLGEFTYGGSKEMGVLAWRAIFELTGGKLVDGTDFPPIISKTMIDGAIDYANGSSVVESDTARWYDKGSRGNWVNVPKDKREGFLFQVCTSLAQSIANPGQYDYVKLEEYARSAVGFIKNGRRLISNEYKYQFNIRDDASRKIIDSIYNNRLKSQVERYSEYSRYS